MKWFRRSKHYDDDDSAWFRDDLQRIRQAYVEQEADYAAISPVAARRRPTTAATWSRWSGSTTTVYSFAYVDGAPRDDGKNGVVPTGRDRHRADDDDDDDVVEYIDAATLPVAHRRPTDRRQPHSPSSTARPNDRTGGSAMTGTMTATRRRNKRAAPPPPALTVKPATVAVVDGAANTATVQRRAAGTISRKKYRAPQPPADVSVPRPQQQQQQRGPCRRAAPVQHRRKGPAPKPPVVQQLQPKPVIAAAAADDGQEAGSNVKRKISQYERDRLMQRVDKIEKHFLDKTATAPKAQTTAVTRPHGFASPAALYTAMAATNLTELDKRAAEICRQRNHRGVGVPLTADHKNAIVTAVIRKSYPKTTTTTAAAAATDDGRRSDKVPAPSAADDEKQLVRHKRLAFFQQQGRTGQADDGDRVAASGTTVVPKLSSHGTQTAAAADASKVDVTPAADTDVVRSGGGGGCSSAAGTV